MPQAGRTISRLAREAHVNPETIRYYERRGIIKQPKKPLEGWRVYDDQALQIVLFVKRAQELGFTLNEIESLLRMRATSSPRTCSRVSARATEKITEIDAKIKDLVAMKEVLAELVSACGSDETTDPCPILEAFAHEN